METKNIIIGIMTIALIASLGINVQPDDTHYCEAREMTYHCDSLSKYYSLPNGKCVHDLLTDKTCRSGWKEIIREIEPKVLDLSIPIHAVLAEVIWERKYEKNNNIRNIIYIIHRSNFSERRVQVRS